MRRKMSALTTTILGAVVTASTVSAQQLPPSNQAPRNKSAAPESTTATEPDADPLFGMTAMRGVRYLLRNGLDYLNYQQYERALKFLREAEKRDGEAEKRGKGELNKTEKLALKQGIERAQRGLRDAADAEAPYALSDRSRRRNGFTAAKPDNQVASNTTHEPSPPTSKASRLDRPSRLGNESEDQGEPIRLASADLVSSDPVSRSSPSPGSTNTKNAPSDDRAGSARSAHLPEIPVLPPAPQLSDLTDSNSKLFPSVRAGDQGPAVAGRVTPRRSAPPSAETPDQDQALAQASRPQQPVAGAAPNQPALITSLPPLDPATDPAAQSQGHAENVAPASAVGGPEPESVVAAPGQPLPKTEAGHASDAAAARTSQKPVQRRSRLRLSRRLSSLPASKQMRMTRIMNFNRRLPRGLPLLSQRRRRSLHSPR